MRFVRIPFANLARRPMRTGLTMVGVGMAVASYIMMMGLARGLERSWAGSIVERRTDVFVVRKGAIEILSTSIDASVVETLRQQPEVAEATAELVDLVSIESGDSALVCGWPAHSYLWETLGIKEGRKPAPDKREVVIGESVASVLGSRVGSGIRLIDQDLTIVGVSHQSGVLIGSAVVMPLSTMQHLFNREGQVTAIHLRMATRADVGADGQDLAGLSARFPALTFTKTEDVANTNRVVGLLRAIASLTSSIGLLMGVVVLVNTLLMSVAERTREIGTLTALGWSSRLVMRMILLEALVVSMVGGVVGIAAGAMGVQWLARATVVRGFVEPQVSTGLMVETLVAALLLGLAASVYPAWRAATMPTAAALRHE
jgi:putative ABC transport system permease protein